MRYADAELARLETELERLQTDTAADWDFETRPGGIIELEFADGSKIVINRHTAAREIWVAARMGGFHFRPPAESDGCWRDTRSGEDITTVLSRCIAAQAGAA